MKYSEIENHMLITEVAEVLYVCSKTDVQALLLDKGESNKPVCLEAITEQNSKQLGI